MKKSISFIRSVVLGLVAACVAIPSIRAQVQATILCSDKTIQAGHPFTVAIQLEHEPHWHTYWVNAGIGTPTTLAWTLPEGFKVGPIQWPAPHAIKSMTGEITGQGYSGTMVLLTEITPPANLKSGEKVSLKVHLDWLMCEEVCQPGGSDLKLDVPVDTAAPAPDDSASALIAKARGELPEVRTDWQVRAARSGKTVKLQLIRDGSTHEPTDLHFFSADGLIAFDQVQAVHATKYGYELSLTVSDDADAKIDRLTGVLASKNGWQEGDTYRGLAVDVPLSGSAQK